jgi:hypothetical protein
MGGGSGIGGDAGAAGQRCAEPPQREPIETLELLPTSYEVLPSTFSVVSSEVNGDCLPDLVTISGSGRTVSVLVGTGDGSFRSVPGDSPRGSSTFPAGGALGDFDRDGRVDLATVGSDQLVVMVRFGSGDGTFGPAVEYPLPTIAGTIGAVDLDHDEDLDLVVPSTDGAGVLLGSSSGAFEWLEQPGSHSPGDSLGLVLNDFDEDGHPDLAHVHSRSRAVQFRLGLGNGGFAPRRELRYEPRPSSIAVSDLNRDEHDDIVFAFDEGGTVGRSPGHIGVLLGDGLGNFTSESDVPAGISPEAVRVADMNLDGWPDLVVTNLATRDGILISLGLGEGRFGALTPVATAFGSRFDQIAVDDFDLDGAPDVAIATGVRVVVLWNRGR